MSDAAVARLIEGSEHLVRALDDGGPEVVEHATARVAQAAAELAASGAWRTRPDLKERLLHARALLDAARARINFLADHAARRLDRLAAMTGGPRTPVYGRSGRRR